MEMKDIVQKLTEGLTSLVTLKTVTAVGQMALNDKGEWEPLDTKNCAAASTSIDLAQGDITTYLDERFATGDLVSLRDYHAACVKEGRAIIEANVRLIGDILKLAKS